MSGNVRERWKVWRDSAIPYIGEITVIQEDGTVLDCPPVFCRFLWERWHNYDRAELVIRSLVVCGIHVENCRELVEKGFTVLEWLTLPTIKQENNTDYPHEPGIKTF